jgi:tetratricopeptide (TPR) repeat protein
LEQALRIYRETGDRKNEIHLLNYVNISIWQLGDYARAWVCFEQALRLAREIGARLEEAVALWNLGMLFSLLGDLTRARGYYEQALGVARETEDPFWESVVQMYLGGVARRLGDQAGAREYGERAVDIAHEMGAQAIEGRVLYSLGHLYQDLGNSDTARSYYEQALRYFRHTGATRSCEMGSLAGLAWAALADHDVAQAQAYVAEILAYLEGGGNLDNDSRPFWIYLTCYQVLQAGGDPRAPAILATAHQILQDQATSIPDDALRHSFLENVAENREIVAEFRRGQLPQ